MQNTILNIVKNTEPALACTHISWSDHFIVEKYKTHHGLDPFGLLLLEQEEKILNYFLFTEQGKNFLSNLNPYDVLNWWQISIAHKNYKALNFLNAWQIFPQPQQLQQIFYSMIIPKEQYNHYTEHDYGMIWRHLKGIYEHNGNTFKQDTQDFLSQRVLETMDFNFYKYFSKYNIVKIKTNNLVKVFNLNTLSLDNLAYQKYPQPYQKINFVMTHASFWSNLACLLNDSDHKINLTRFFPELFEHLKKPIKSKEFWEFFKDMLTVHWREIPKKSQLFAILLEYKPNILLTFKVNNYSLPVDDFFTLKDSIRNLKNFNNSIEDIKKYEFVCKNFIVPHFKNFSNLEKNRLLLWSFSNIQFTKISDRLLSTWIKTEELPFTLAELKENLNNEGYTAENLEKIILTHQNVKNIKKHGLTIL